MWIRQRIHLRIRPRIRLTKRDKIRFESTQKRECLVFMLHFFSIVKEPRLKQSAVVSVRAPIRSRLVAQGPVKEHQAVELVGNDVDKRPTCHSCSCRLANTVLVAHCVLT